MIELDGPLETLPWDVQSFQHRVGKIPIVGIPDTNPNPDPMSTKEKEAMDKFFKVKPDPTYIDIPAIILDNNGRIVTWYLPGLIHPARVVSKFSMSAFQEHCSEMLNCRLG